MISTQKIRKDFDRIATLSEHDQQPDGVYDRFLQSHVPAECAHALEIGCGTGSFTRLLAKQAGNVAAIDLSDEMIRVARQRSSGFPNIDYSVADLLRIELPSSRFDCIVMVATLHHLPAEQVLEKLKKALKRGGVLILHDLLTPQGAIELSAEVVRLPVSSALRFLRTGRFWARREIRRAWDEHGKDEHYLTRREVAAMRDRHLPGAFVKYHLLWRYTLVWRKQES